MSCTTTGYWGSEGAGKKEVEERGGKERERERKNSHLLEDRKGQEK